MTEISFGDINENRKDLNSASKLIDTHDRLRAFSSSTGASHVESDRITEDIRKLSQKNQDKLAKL